MTCVAAMVDVGSNVGGAVGLSPPHAAKSVTRARMMPVRGNPGKNRAEGVRFKAASPCFYDLGAAFESFTLPY